MLSGLQLERIWIVFLTLTFREETAYDVAIAKFKRLVRVINKKVVGNQYTNIVKHSYFSYVLGIEYQQQGSDSLPCADR